MPLNPHFPLVSHVFFDVFCISGAPPCRKLTLIFWRHVARTFRDWPWVQSQCSSALTGAHLVFYHVPRGPVKGQLIPFISFNQKLSRAHEIKTISNHDRIIILNIRNCDRWITTNMWYVKCVKASQQSITTNWHVSAKGCTTWGHERGSKSVSIGKAKM